MDIKARIVRLWTVSTDEGNVEVQREEPQKVELRGRFDTRTMAMHALRKHGIVGAEYEIIITLSPE